MSITYKPKGSADDFMRRVGEKYPWLHPDYEEDDATWQMRAVKARERIKRAVLASDGEGR